LSKKTSSLIVYQGTFVITRYTKQFETPMLMYNYNKLGMKLLG